MTSQNIPTHNGPHFGYMTLVAFATQLIDYIGATVAVQRARATYSRVATQGYI
ncbi:hypothetical protein BDV26DRAFT_256054 [Aspergillus bertholletiae]|uniref:Uncharacterized protein n=1 Tax=Aspergillus bertholletiae TaxID=1226010 RepID=A0A5N7BH17_9EURO|nr:hypothetical protein BDV26DRAFT_256054 [Aspergillus bertholletiae]